MGTKTPPVLLVVALLLLSGTAAVAVGAAPTTSSLDDDAVSAVDGPTAGQPQTGTSYLRGTPDIEVLAPDNEVTPGRANELTLQISNSGQLRSGSSAERESVTTARNVRVEADAGGTPITVETRERAIGPVTDSTPGEATVALSVPDDIEPGTYTLDVDVTYSHTYSVLPSGSNNVNERTRTVYEDVEVEVTEDARFAIVDAGTDAQVGDSGTLEAEIENTGAEVAREADVTLESASAGLSFGDGEASDTARIAELEPGETATVSYDAAVAPDSPVREYAVTGTVQFRDPDGIQRTDDTLSVGVAPRAEQTFTIGDVESDLYVGEQGDIRATVTNEGPAEARNVVVRYADESPNVVPIEGSVAVGTLGPGESASFELPIEIGGEAEAVDRVADMAIQYRNTDDEGRQYEDVELLYDVGEERDAFLLSVEDREVQAGNSVAFDVTVTNNLDEPVSGVEARLFADSPLDSSDDEGFTETLDPGESTTMTFDLTAESGATPKTYPVSFDFRYDDADGDSQLSDTSRVAITVVESEGGFPLFSAFGLLITVVVVAGGAVYYVQRE